MAGGGSGRQIMLRVEDIQAHKELERTLARQASHDAISGLPNRSLFLERVRQALAPNGGGSPVAVLVIEVDGLHTVIDGEGYAAGDRVLARLADRMADGLGDGVTLAHIRPGLFGAVVPGDVPEAVFDLSSGQVVAAEALLRISDHDGRPIPPLQVVPAAEASGLIVDIGRRVLQQAAGQAAQWKVDHGVRRGQRVSRTAEQGGLPRRRPRCDQPPRVFRLRR